jgi:hypothetical protein
MEAAIVRSRPEESGLAGRFGKGEDGGVGLGADSIAIDWAAGRLQRGRVGAGQVGADCVPGLTLVGALEDPLAAT